MKCNNKRVAFVIAVVISGALMSCGGSKRAPAKVEKAKEAGPALDKEQGPSREEVFARKMSEIRFLAQRDPFKPLAIRRAIDQGEVTSPLQQYDVAQMRLVGVIWGTASPIALVRTPDGEEFKVLVNTSIGKNDGKVITILPDQVLIVEKFFDYRGQLQQEKYALRLQRGQEK